MSLDHLNKNSKAMKLEEDEREESFCRAVARGKITVSRAVFDAIKESISRDDKKENSGGKNSSDADTAVSGDKQVRSDILEAAANANRLCERSVETMPNRNAFPVGSCKIDFDFLEEALEIYCTCAVKTCDEKGAKLEAFAGVGVALLTIYNMCKEIDKNMQIDQIHLIEQSSNKGRGQRDVPLKTTKPSNLN
ncbi:MAG: cyclic pyranopterin monophosphate synthase MoaC [Anaerovoracaceae bacterium]